MDQNTTCQAASPLTLAKIQALIDAGAAQPGGLLPVLHTIQDATGFIPPESVPLIADAFNLSRAEVHGVITFYHHFRTTPPARHVVRICRAEACQSLGVATLIAHAEQRLGCRMHETSADGTYSLEPVYCLGHCATSPAIMIGDEVHARVTPSRFDALIKKTRESA
ncbi:formate dehydrogenase subunit gamma [Noviherbaspirillum sedimenti]|uniref:Formate dehydrogenase subunit gamma n=1 Tax=Noviherbaspirillum sedimenti TaxID=2320865 RepID=A0A3A3G7T4_9BURK|nr:formate dehydrogenase subunit gamma [Noviherbaspirillum sedimenti]RJG02612.1 formate dehydrogenase subunit gamma [Noviherbaspirillum sedimenti]